jgi:HrpA-like RNA helicase
VQFDYFVSTSYMHAFGISAKSNLSRLTGRHLCNLPVDPNIGKLLLMGCVFQCLSPALTIAAALAHRDPFVLPIDRKREADAAKRSFAGDSCRLLNIA